MPSLPMKKMIHHRPQFPSDSSSMKLLLRPVVDRVCKTRGGGGDGDTRWWCCRRRNLFGTAVASSDTVFVKGEDGSSSNSSSSSSRRKVPIHLRKSMVESYVSRYRVANAGKFPSISEAKKEVGGGHYTIRKIMQELQYNSKLISEDQGSNTLQRGKSQDTSTSASTQKGADGKLTSGHDGVSPLTNDINGALVQDSSNLKTGEADVTSVESIYDQRSSHQAVAEDHAVSQVTVELDATKTKSIYSDSSSKEVMDEDCAADQREELELSKNSIHESSSHAVQIPRDSSAQPSDDSEQQQKSSLWGNLKSLADNFFSLWRKR